ncbi:MAG TPA: GNAT family N-acetyltransferase [Blastocatellia bacterium]|nr:GNAT family N-acetyltransferase [Blastocatellia bacterium]HMV84611.1 GNAT family N-acetyltransferase [Blastocatellia bacterium]HMX25016.1 GNAT family N-acetyltransferase [Blastocatellia bacterium]HMY74737.1 GNAT family N-acetyltransferase [Blastocatellia bacterium]HMZ20973.1 GNAT family N-acetyltransferase [Blastocatellia bacterium]
MIRRADTTELEAALALLEAVNLPLEGVAEHFGEFLLALEDGRVAGCVGQERYGNVALLRSLAVSPDAQRGGLGRALTTQLLAEARAAGVREIVLLTTTARDFFARHFGFIETERGQFDDAFTASPEWRLPRCSSAACMSLRLDR